ncbi:hypothetical protein, partial [Mesorhizobium sp. M7A.F.Ca.CA.002.04.1.1]
RKTELQENSVQIPLILQFQSRYPPQSTGQINGLRIVHGRPNRKCKLRLLRGISFHIISCAYLHSKVFDPMLREEQVGRDS